MKRPGGRRRRTGAASLALALVAGCTPRPTPSPMSTASTAPVSAAPPPATIASPTPAASATLPSVAVSPEPYRAAPRGRSVIRVPHAINSPPTDFLKAAPGWKVTLAGDGLIHPRWLTVAENGDVFVVETRIERPGAQPHRVVVYRDTDHDGRYDRRFIWSERLSLPFGIAFHGGYLYVANTGSVVRWPYQSGQTAADDPPETVIAGIPERGMRQHWTRNIVFAPDSRSLFVTVGSKENADIEDAMRATILRYPVGADGKPTDKPTIFASGMRNPIGMAFRGDTLWAVVSERDYLGDNLVPDFLTPVRDGDFFGWPYYFLGRNHDPRLPERPDLEENVVVPPVLFPAHSAPLGLVFDKNGDAIIALHGSQNRSTMVGYKVVRIHLATDGHSETLLEGWLRDPSGRDVYGRPAGVAWDKDNSLLIVDDWAGRVWRLSRR